MSTDTGAPGSRDLEGSTGPGGDPQPVSLAALFGAPEPDDPVAPPVEAVGSRLAELTSDLQRVHAEYANYRKRVERDRELIRATAAGGVLGELLSVLDDIDRARQHDELEGAFKSVGESLEATVARIGLEKYGSAGEPFDPNVHEALAHEVSDEVSGPTVVAVYQPGYRYGGRVLRAALVRVCSAGA